MLLNTTSMQLGTQGTLFLALQIEQEMGLTLRAKPVGKCLELYHWNRNGAGIVKTTSPRQPLNRNEKECHWSS